MRLSLPCLLLAGLTLLSTPARADSTPQQLSLGVGTLGYYSFRRPSASFTLLEASYHRALAAEGPGRWVLVGGGVRTGLPAADSHLPLEGFVEVQFTAHLGPWEAAVGPELGVTGFSRLLDIPLPAQELFSMENARLGPVYAALGAEPLRFRWSWLSLSALEVRLGTALSSPGTALRLHINLLRLGINL